MGMVASLPSPLAMSRADNVQTSSVLTCQAWRWVQGARKEAALLGGACCDTADGPLTLQHLEGGQRKDLGKRVTRGIKDCQYNGSVPPWMTPTT